MFVIRLIMLSVVLALAGCGSAEWVHPNKGQENFVTDYNACESAAYNDPKMQGGVKLQIQQYIDRCLAKKGWELRETTR